MDTGIASIWVACIGGSFSLLAIVLQRFKTENKKDHDTVMAMLRLMRRAQDRTEIKLDKVDDRLSNHLEFHSAQEVLDNGRNVYKTGTQGDTEVSK